MKKFLGLCWILLACMTPVQGQSEDDTLRQAFPVKALIIPATLATSGLLVQGKISRQLQHQVVDRYPGGIHTQADKFLPFAPAALSLGLGAAGVKGRHMPGQQLLLTLLANVTAQGVTQSLKLVARYPRPDASGFDAFPSGHTTAAFTSATLLHKEYGHRSMWYSVGGYAVASSVGALRIMKNEHWLSDVLFGAGVGIGATHLVYWGYPWVKSKIRRKNKRMTD
ncbi:phosphatase PAP2 family protein [Arundinibacter roseus]|uniref:Phosphatase PAP2 family protein n=1 Tax=Arundinibacter roseus TaxID=2070510 RepID=A0A4R4KL07_9BACT|nr:phosphatase PAP2 family protein [Arundinibacter roseus]TDB68898.1 phosphatase PAP2 family protein [Arundinibacter roseus]